MIDTREIAENAPTLLPAAKEPFFRNILFATDFSPASDQALDYAASLARRFGSKIYLAHIITVDAFPLMSPVFAVRSLKELRAAAEQTMEKSLQTERLNCVSSQVVIHGGALWPAREDIIKLFDIDLLVCGTRGAGAVRKVLIGSGAEEIFRKAKVPVLTVGPATDKDPFYELEFKNILFATHFGKGAKREAKYAFELAQEHRSRLKFLHVIPHREAYGEHVLAEMIKESETHLRSLVPPATELHCKLDFEVAVGTPVVNKILKTAQETNTNLIVMGAKARGGHAGNVPYTKAYRVASAAHCPVLTVRSYPDICTDACPNP
jgi:nucleotide-binding universal stress UspA family protein